MSQSVHRMPLSNRRIMFKVRPSCSVAAWFISKCFSVSASPRLLDCGLHCWKSWCEVCPLLTNIPWAVIHSDVFPQCNIYAFMCICTNWNPCACLASSGHVPQHRGSCDAVHRRAAHPGPGNGGGRRAENSDTFLARHPERQCSPSEKGHQGRRAAAAAGLVFEWNLSLHIEYIWCLFCWFVPRSTTKPWPVVQLWMATALISTHVPWTRLGCLRWSAYLTSLGKEVWVIKFF